MPLEGRIVGDVTSEVRWQRREPEGRPIDWSGTRPRQDQALRVGSSLTAVTSVRYCLRALQELTPMEGLITVELSTSGNLDDQ